MVAQKKPAKHTKPPKEEAVPHYCRCPKCHYVWKAKVPHPKSCPECKTRFGWYRKKRGI